MEGHVHVLLPVRSTGGKGLTDDLSEETEGFCFPITIHPDVAGKPRGSRASVGRQLTVLDVLLMLERFIEWVNTHDGVEWVTMQEIAEDYRSRVPPPDGAAMPVGL